MNLRRFEARASDDCAKRDLELTCTECGEVVCDIEHGDNLDLLCGVAADHQCEHSSKPTDEERAAARRETGED